jgi:pimeloyl-ACP methyl ester carboxylesterase
MLGRKAPYTMQRLANDTAGLMDALKIKQADVFGYSLGGETAQQFTVIYPEKVNRLIIVAASRGGKDSIPKPAEFKKLQSEIVNKSLHNIPITREEMKSLSEASLADCYLDNGCTLMFKKLRNVCVSKKKITFS